MAGEVIDMDALRASLNHLRLDHEDVRQAFAVTHLLHCWIYENCRSVFPCVTVEVSVADVQIWIGTFCVWASDSGVPLTFDACAEAYRKQIQSMLEPFQKPIGKRKL